MSAPFIGFCNAVGPDTKNQVGWRHQAAKHGIDPDTVSCLTWHETDKLEGREIVARFKVRTGDPTCYLVRK